MISSLFNDILDFIFPPHCPACDAYVEKSGEWCEECLSKTLRPHRLSLDDEARRVIDRAFALGYYHGTALRALIIDLKYRGRLDRMRYIENFLSSSKEMLLDERSQINALVKMEAAVPVPLHEEKEKARGFNQAELIFKNWFIALGMEWERALVRRQATVPQHGLTAKERRDNMAGAFEAAAGNTVNGKNIILVDDIFTTGATCTACAKELRKMGAKSVSVLVLASDHG